jgi:hypothetical protein
MALKSTGGKRVSSSIVVGVIGSGSITKKAVTALIADRLSTETPRFIVPVTDEHWSMAVRSAVQWAIAREYPYEVILDGSESEVDGIEDVLEGASVTHKVTAVETKLVSLLADADEDAILLIAWDDKDDASQRALLRATKRDLSAYDLLDGLQKLRFDDEPEQPAVVEEPASEAPKRKRRTKAEMAAARAAEAAGAEVVQEQPAVVGSGPIELIATADEAQTLVEGISMVAEALDIKARPLTSMDVVLFSTALQDLLTEAARQGAELAVAQLRAESTA